MSHMILENCGSSIKWFIKSERKFPEECAKERVVMEQKKWFIYFSEIVTIYYIEY